MPGRNLNFSMKGVIMHNEFSQILYINKNNWKNVNPSMREGAWIGHRVDPTTGKLKYGTCHPLSVIYLMSARWGEFISFIETPKGKALIRGIKNAQLEQHKYPDVNKNTLREFLYDVMSTVGLNIDKRFDAHGVLDSQGIAKRIYNCMRYESHGLISMKRPGGGHAMAIKIESGMMKFFDPNKGEFCLPFDRNNRTGCDAFLTDFLAKYYLRYNRVSIETFRNGTLV